MGDLAQLTPDQIIEKSIVKFTDDCGLIFEREKSFALQQILPKPKSDFAFKIAQSNKKSLLNAMANVANIGLSLNPANAHAYLVPRDGAIHLDISYMGFLKLATDSGVIKMAKAEIVREKDNFVYRGMFENPLHEITNPFGKAEARGEVVGVYCVAVTKDDRYITDFMDMDQIEKIKLSSKAFTSGKRCPWVDFPEEMMKKSMIKRARKTWPQSQGLERLNEAIKIVNEHEGLSENDELMTDDQHRAIQKYLTKYDKKEDEVSKIADVNHYKDLTFSDGQKIIAYINQVSEIEGSVNAIKNSILAEDVWAVHEAYSELSEHEASVLTRAPTKGGCLTVDERSYIMSEDFRKAVNQELDRIADEELDKQQLAVNQ